MELNLDTRNARDERIVGYFENISHDSLQKYNSYNQLGDDVKQLISQRQKNNAQNRERDWRIACFFINNIPNEKEEGFSSLLDVYQTFYKLDANVQNLIISDDSIALKLPNGSRASKSPFVQLFTVPKDIFSHIINCVISDREEKREVRLIDSPYTSYGRDGHPKFDMKMGYKPPVDPALELISTAATKKKIWNLPVVEALGIIGRYNDQKIYKVEDFVENPMNAKSSLNCGPYQHNDISKKMYCFSLEDMVRINYEQMKKIDQIIKEPGRRDWDRYKMTQKDIELLKPIKDIIDVNLLLKNLKIDIACEELSVFEKIKDRTLFIIPLFASTAMPDLIHHNCSGFLQWSAGAAGAWGSGYVAGHYVSPALDTWKSVVGRINTWFGEKNRLSISRRWDFAMIGLSHYFLTSLAGKCVNSYYMPVQWMGYGLTAMRGYVFLCESFASNWRQSSFHMNKYENPIEHRNKDDKSYTLGDLMNGPLVKNKKTPNFFSKYAVFLLFLSAILINARTL